MSIQNIVKTPIARIEYPVRFSADMVAYLHGYTGRYTGSAEEGCLRGPRFKMNKLTKSTAYQYGFGGGSTVYSIKSEGKTVRYVRQWDTVYVDGQKFSAASLWKFLNENA